jgi:uncharacterized membrane protein
MSSYANSGRIARIANRISSGKVNIEMPFFPSVMSIMLLAVGYMIVSAVGISVFDKCSNEDVKNSRMYMNIRRYLTHTLTIALTIPATLLATSLVRNDTAFFFIIYGLMGFIGGAMALDLSTKCPSENKQTTQMWTGIGMGIYLMFLFFGFFGVNRRL